MKRLRIPTPILDIVIIGGIVAFAMTMFVLAITGCDAAGEIEPDAAPRWPPCHKLWDYCNFDDAGFGVCHPEGCEFAVLHLDDGGTIVVK